MHLRLSTYKSPMSSILLVTDETGVLRALDFVGYESRMNRLLRDHYREYTLTKGTPPAKVVRELDAYFAGDMNASDRIPTATGGTAFQRAVWRALRSIKPGTTKTYGQIAAKIGRPTASRAVGAANGANPIALIVPCHRVIGANGTLTGYASGLARKQWLLEHEVVHTAAAPARKSPTTRTRTKTAACPS
ncbi:MAG TPA: methylated-DNA--[protein]-cysteine S-methyltransferase [Lacipirellulaceae bacterium]|nr:methylated-DNA--[protein]-cysteine S-methyltransferase [Lacipirellulaceae bacterium]